MENEESTIESKPGRQWPRPLAGLRGLHRARLPNEISSGFTLAALVIPLNIGYAQVAGLPPAMGLYAAIFPLILYSLFTSSRHVVGGPGPATAALIAAALVGFGEPGDPQRVQYALALGLMCSLLFFLAWFFRLAFLQNFLSRAVLIGFVSGLGVQVFTSQLRKILGVKIDITEQLESIGAQVKQTVGVQLETSGYFLNVIELVREIPNANLYAVAIGLGSLIAVRLLKRYWPRVPGALVVLVVMTVIVVVFDLDQKGVSVLGDLPAGLPAVALPAVPLTDYLKLFPGAVALVAITLCEGLLLSRGYAQKHGYKADGNQLLFAYGISNAAAGLSGSMVSGNSVSRSAAMESAGGYGQLTSLIAAGVVAVILAFFTDLLTLLPNAALAGIVANAVISLIELGNLKGLFRMRRSEFWVAATCLLAVLVVGPLRAVVIAFLLSIIDLLKRSSAPHTAILEESIPGKHFITRGSGATAPIPGLIVYRFTAPLYFANANVFAEEVERLVNESDTPVKWFVFDAAAVADMDTTGAEVMNQVVEMIEGRGCVFAISRANERLRKVLKEYELEAVIGSDRMFDTNREAVTAFRKEND
jgi:high affinity sulfate transporter 1